jgi:hypothetical protein
MLEMVPRRADAALTALTPAIVVVRGVVAGIVMEVVTGRGLADGAVGGVIFGSGSFYAALVVVRSPRAAFAGAAASGLSVSTRN